MPEPIRTEIEFVSGGPSLWLLAAEVEGWHLPSRLAVIQHTYRPDMVDMFYDRSLWLRLLAFAKEYATESELLIIDRPHGTDFSKSPTQKHEVSLEHYLTTRVSDSDEDWFPPERLVLRINGIPALVVASEAWCNVGGPDAYADSLTYSIFSNENLEARVIAFLHDAEVASGWNISRSVHPAPVAESPPPSFVDRVLSWLRRDA